METFVSSSSILRQFLALIETPYGGLPILWLALSWRQREASSQMELWAFKRFPIFFFSLFFPFKDDLLSGLFLEGEIPLRPTSLPTFATSQPPPPPSPSHHPAPAFSPPRLSTVAFSSRSQEVPCTRSAAFRLRLPWEC